MKQINGKYEEVRTEIPEPVRRVLDMFVPGCADVSLMEMSAKERTEGGSCGKCSCTMEAEPKANIGAFIDCIDVELGELVHTVDYVGCVPVEKKGDAINSLRQSIDAATHAVETLEGGK